MSSKYKFIAVSKKTCFSRAYQNLDIIYTVHSIVYKLYKSLNYTHTRFNKLPKVYYTRYVSDSGVVSLHFLSGVVSLHFLS